mgnify:FL=1
MYSFYLNNRREKGFAYIDELEEKALYKLYQKKDIAFVKQLWSKYYEDYTFEINELEAAQRDMMKYLSIENWNISNEEEKEQMYLMYKLVTIISYALFHKECLLGSGD